jgi:hypothetical protein
MLMDPNTLEIPAVGVLFPSTRRRRNVKPCGTAAAYRRHFRRGGPELPVDSKCAAWHAGYQRTIRKRRKK